MPPDYHIHTLFSDGNDMHELYIKKAVEQGFTEIGFSDHVSVIPAFWATDPARLKLMRDKVRGLALQWKNTINIRFGLEMDFYPGYEKDIENIIHDLQPDYVIGSVHFIGLWNFDNQKESNRSLPPDDFFRIYYQLISQAAASGLFDIIGHFDLVKKFNPVRPEKAEKYEMMAIESIAKSGITIELNTNGFNKPCKAFYPSDIILKTACQAGIPVTLGSDAHQASKQGQYFDIAIQKLLNAGYNNIMKFDNRTPITANLES